MKSPREVSRVEERRVAGRGRWLVRRFRDRAAGRVPWARFLSPLSEPGGPISGTGLSSGIMRLAHGLPGHDRRTGLASPGTWLAPLRRPAGASSGLLTPWRRRPRGSSPSLVHVMTSGPCRRWSAMADAPSAPARARSGRGAGYRTQGAAPADRRGQQVRVRDDALRPGGERGGEEPEPSEVAGGVHALREQRVDLGVLEREVAGDADAVRDVDAEVVGREG